MSFAGFSSRGNLPGGGLHCKAGMSLMKSDHWTEKIFHTEVSIYKHSRLHPYLGDFLNYGKRTSCGLWGQRVISQRNLSHPVLPINMQLESFWFFESIFEIIIFTSCHDPNARVVEMTKSKARFHGSNYRMGEYCTTDRTEETRKGE